MSLLVFLISQLVDLPLELSLKVERQLLKACFVYFLVDYSIDWLLGFSVDDWHKIDFFLHLSDFFLQFCHLFDILLLPFVNLRQEFDLFFRDGGWRVLGFFGGTNSKNAVFSFLQRDHLLAELDAASVVSRCVFLQMRDLFVQYAQTHMHLLAGLIVLMV